MKNNVTLEIKIEGTKTEIKLDGKLLTAPNPCEQTSEILSNIDDDVKRELYWSLRAMSTCVKESRLC